MRRRDADIRLLSFGLLDVFFDSLDLFVEEHRGHKVGDAFINQAAARDRDHRFDGTKGVVQNDEARRNRHNCQAQQEAPLRKAIVLCINGAQDIADTAAHQQDTEQMRKQGHHGFWRSDHEQTQTDGYQPDYQITLKKIGVSVLLLKVFI